jgi:hypothetical protein
MKPVLITFSILMLYMAGTAEADEYHDRVLVLETGLAAGPPAGFPVDAVEPIYGNGIAIEGVISEVGEFFVDLLPAGPYEITYVFAGATCISPSSGIYPPCPPYAWGLFTDGTLSVFLDTTPDADFTSGDTFTDGELVLFANQVEHRIWDQDPIGQCPGAEDWTSGFSFTGGSWYPRISNPPFLGRLRGEIDGNVPAGLTALGFTFNVQTAEIDLSYNVATRPVTWGQVKSLYR